MAYQNFIPTVWAEAINRELERLHVFVADTNRQYEGKVAKQGDSVRILGVGKPTITRQTGKKITLSDAEEVSDLSTTLNINQIAYFNYKVDDIDKRQAVGGLMEALSKETSEGLADEMDKFVADMSLDKSVIVDSSTVTTLTDGTVLAYLDGLLAKLYENDVKASSKVTITVPPAIALMIKRAYVSLDTNNHEEIKNGLIGKYNNALIRMSNNVAKDSSGNYMIQVKTDKAIAFVNPMTHTEAYRPEKSFSDAVKGFVLFDGMIARPKELIVGRCKI